MFATVTGALPRITAAGAELAALEASTRSGDADPAALATAADDLVRELIREQEAAGLEPVVDGQVRTADLHARVVTALDGIDDVDGALRVSGTPRRHGTILVDDWRFAAACTTSAAKQAIPGPYTLGRRVDGSGSREALTLALADALAPEVEALAAAGCPLIEVEEPAAVSIGEDEAERRLFIEAQRRLLARAGAVHASLAVVDGDASGAGLETFLATPYASFLFDLIAGPDHWRLIARTPGDIGIVCGALDARATSADEPAILVWAAHYAASTGGRGTARVGLSTSSSLRDLTRERMTRKLRVLGDAARIAAGSDEEVARALDPRATGRRRGPARLR